MMKKAQLQILLILFLSLFSAIDASACKCQGQATVSGSVKSADIVFSGKVISRTLTSNYDSLGVKIMGDTTDSWFKWSKFPSLAIKVKVDKIYKGKSSSETIIILTPARSASCGYGFELGEKYIIYATITDELLPSRKLERQAFDNKTFWTHQCTRTQEWNKLEEEELKKVVHE